MPESGECSTASCLQLTKLVFEAAEEEGADPVTFTAHLDLLRHEFGRDLHGVWLFGSRARGEAPGPESDRRPARRLEPERAELASNSPELVEQRRRIRSVFMQEVDRDKIVLFGTP